MEPPKTSLVSEEQSSTEIDDRHYSLQAEQEDTQKRTFTSWVNSQLEKHSSPSLILDLYSDIGKGHVLLDLLEVLSGQQLPREKGSNTFQCRSNIENALTFLKNRSLKLINIHVADIIEGKPSIVLGLIWIIILHFHIEELAKVLACGYSHPSLDSSGDVDLSPATSPTAKINVKARERWKISAKKAVLLWAKEQCDKHGSISVADFKSSWRNGLAFLAIIHALRPGLVDVEKAKERSNRENLKEAFQIAEKELNIPQLLEPEDVDVISPDEKSIMTYVAQFLRYFKSLPVAEDKMQGKVRETLSWLSAQECKLTKLLTELENASFHKKFEAMLSFTETFNEEKKAFLPILESKRKVSELDEDYLEMKEARDNLSSQMNEWKAKLDNLLPPPLDATEAWLKETEQHLAHNLPVSQDDLKAMAVLEEKMRAIQNLMESFQQHLEILQSFENRDNAGMLLVPPQKLEEMRRRFSKVQLENFGIFVEYYRLSSSAVFKELTSKLNIWHIKFGTKETVELLLLDWHHFIEEHDFLGQLDTALQVCEAQKNEMIQIPNLGKMFKMIEAQISKCKEYINNVNDTLKKVLTSWATYMENVQLLKTWLEETRKDHPKKISTETLAAWNSRHGSLNEAGNFLIESSNVEVGSAVSGELKKLNRKWAKLIKKTKFEMKLLRMQEEEMMLVTDNNGNVESSMKFNLDMFNNPVEPSKKPPKMCFDKAEIFPVSFHADPCIPEEFSEDEVRLNFEKAHKELEASVLKAMQLVGQKANSGEPHSKYEEAFSILDTNILSKFLKAAEQLKSILSACEKALVEERSKDVCERWEAVRCEIMSYIHLKLKIEREKLNKTFSNLNKQINKEKKLLNAGKTKGLIEEHEQGSLGELNTCLQALKTMSEKMTKVEKESKMELPIAEYEQKKKELQKSAATIYSELISRTGDDHSSEKGDFTPASVNEERASSQNPEAEKSERIGMATQVSLESAQDSEDVSCINLEPEKDFQNGGHHTEKLEIDGDLALKRLKESYDTARHNLKLHLSSIRENITPPLIDDVRNVSSLQKKLQTLEALESKGDSSWKLFDSVASQLVKLSSEMDSPVISEKSLEDLHKEWDELQFALDKRMESLKAALALVLPIENEWVLLCRSEEQLCKRDIPRCVMNKTDLLFKKVKKIQESIANCIEQCNSQEQNSPAGWTVDQRDRQAIGLMISKYKTQLEEMGQKIQVIETILQDLETFLVSLRRIQCSVDVSTPLSCSPQPMQEISHMEKEAKSLDEKLKQLRIYLVEAESGKKMSCEEFVAALLVKENPAIGSEAAAEFTQNQKTEEFSLKNNELFKNIQDIYDLISTIGLRDPTIPAIRQRLKLINELWKKLDRCAPEMKTLNEIISQLSQLPKAQENEVRRQWGLTQDLWEKTKLAITEKREHCKSTMELLKQYQSSRTCLTSIILKQEIALSQQASYMGKENLQKIIAKVNMVKEEFNNHSEDIERLSQMCKNLQSQLNKMKSFEEPPFENEANAIVDRWLDINERTENYCENLERALALWDKLLNLSNLIDEWSDAMQKNLEDGNLTEKELEELEADVLFQEKKLEEFDRKVDEIQYLLNGSEPPLELQVIKSSLLNKMELIRKHLPNKSVPTEGSDDVAELKGDLDLAKTQIGMTESLLKALAPSDTLEIFTKLEEIHQKILHQKQHMKLLQKETGYLNPDVIELKKQLISITDLFNSKKQIFQDHFTTLLNKQCKRFDDWFSNAQISLEECFDSSETKEAVEEKIHQLMGFLNFEGKGSDIDEVKTVLNQVKNYLPKVNVNQLSSWVRDQEVELQRVISKCQAREIELHIFLQQFARLEKDFKSLEKWLRIQEEKLQEVQIEKTGLEHFYQILLKQREWFDSFDWRANYLKNSEFLNDETVLESAQLVSRYKRLLSHVHKSLGVSQLYCAERKHFEELVRSMLCWLESLKKSVLEMSAEESEIPPEERLFKMQEIALLKEEGNAKLQTITAVGEHLKCDDKDRNLAIQQIVSDVQKNWDCTIHLVIDCLRDQEQLKHQMEQVKQTEEDTKTVFYEVGKQKQELNIDLHPSSQEVQSQLNNYSALLKETEGLTFLLNELTRQRNSLEACTNSFFSVESLMALQHLYKSLLTRLQVGIMADYWFNTTKLLESCVGGHQQCEELTTLLITSLEELLGPEGAEQKQVQCDILCQAEDRLQEVVALMDSIRLEQTCIKDEIDAPQIKQKYLKTTCGLEHETEGIHSDICKHNILTKEEMDNETTNTGKLENSFRVKNQMERQAPELFPEWLTSKGQLPSNLALESEERAASVAGQELKGNLMEAHNFQSSASQCAKQQQKSEQILADDYLNESPQQQHGYQKKLQATCGWSEMPQTILPLTNGKVIEANPTPLSIIHPSPESQGYLEDQAIAGYAEMEQKVNKVKISTAELDIVLMKDQLREIEDLYLQLEKQKAQALSLWQGHSTVAEGSKSDHQDPHGVTSSCWNRLLQELMAVKEAKQNQFNLVNRYQECLAAFQSSMKHLLAEKENMNTGPMEDTVLLENLNKLLASTQKGSILLNKLKTEQENLSRHLSSLDRELIRSQVNQAEQRWKQMEDCLQKKQFCIAAEVEEFKLCMDKAQELQRCLQQQHDLQTGLGTPGKEEHSCPLLIPLELHILKHNISLLKRNAEIQMKRMWSSPGKTALENTINDLQRQVEELEQMTPKENVQITDSHPQIYEIRKKIEDAILETRILMLHPDERAALYPDDLLLQIKCCKAVISDAEGKEPAFMRLADEAQHVASHMPSKEGSALSILSHELQTGYQLLILKSSQRLQQLESQLGKRENLFANIEKFEAQLQKMKTMSSLDVDKTSLKSEFDHMQNLLEKTPKKIQEMETLVDANYCDAEGLNAFEQLFLNDCLRSLRIRAKRIHRVIQIKGCLVQNKMEAYKKFSEEIRALQQDLSNLLFDELELDPEELLSRSQEIKDKLNMLKEKTSAIQSRLSYLDQYQEIWKWLDLKWDTSPLDELKEQFCKAKDNLDKRVKYLKNLFAEYDRHQIVLSEIEATVSSIQKECGDLKDLTSSTSETSLIIGKKMIWRVEHVRYITQEAFKLFKKNKTFSTSLKKTNVQQIKSLDAKIDGLEQMIQSMILANQEIYKYEQGFQSKLGHNLRTLKQIQSELQQPVLLDLKIQMIPYEMMYCKVLKGAIEAEICAAEDIIKEKSSAQQTLPHPESLDKEIEEFQNLKIQLLADFAEHTGALDEAFKMVKLYNKAVEKTADLLSQCEAFLSTPLLSLHKLEESHLDFNQKQEESEVAKAEVEALTYTLKKSIKSKAKLQMEKTLGDLTAKNLAVREQSQKGNSYIQSFKKANERICAELNNAEKVLWKSLYHVPVSYKEALQHSEQSKTLSSQLASTKEDLMKLRRDSQSLSLMCKENGGVLIVPIVSMLWLKWLCLFNTAKEWEGKCEEQNQEWKSVSEELERETIILDNLQDELPESLQDKQRATKEELQAFLESASNYIENVDTEKLLLRLILCRLRNILSVPESLSGKEGLPIVGEIQNMQQRTEELCQKAQKEKETVQSEIVYRTKCNEELEAMKTSLQGIISQLCDIDLEAPNEKALKLEEIQSVVDSKKQIMEDLQIKYAEIYKIVPVDIAVHLEDCKRTLHDLEEKVSTEFLKNSPHYSTEKKIEDINKGLQAVENMLQQKSKNIAKAKEIQKRIWDLVDLWHYKMNELDSEVQDIVEQDPDQAQELMDRLMIPLQRYQQVSQHAERRTTSLNKAASKMEECDELLKSTKVWLENTSHLLTEEVKSDSTKALNKYASALEMALEDSEQKQSILSAISPELKELSPLIETDSMVQELMEVNEQVKALQQKIMEILPRIQQLADDVEAIESELKTMEKDVEKIRTILSPSEDTLDFSPKEHLKHCKVILAHICPMQKALAEIQSYKANLRLTDMRMQPLSIFQRTKQLLKELKVLERITEEQNALLEPIVKEVEEIEQQIDFLKQGQFPKSNLDELSTEIPWPAQSTSFLKGEEVERVKRQIALLCQQKEGILTTMKNALVELHQNQELPEAEDSDLESPEKNGSAVELQPKKRGSLALLPSLVEEAEDSSFHNEEVDTDTTEMMGNEDPLDSPTKGKSSTQVTNPPECLWRSLSNTKATEDTVRPDSEPAQVLHVCQAQIAELEVWLDQVKESLGSKAQIRQMQQSVEQHLAACQVMLSEIEQKVMWLLEDCKSTSTSNSSGLEQETENLSLKLKDVKCKLEKVQSMLQDKYTEEQMSTDEKTSVKFPQFLHFDSSSSFPSVTSDRPLFGRPNDLQHQQELMLKLSEQNNLIDFLEVYMEKIQPHPRHSTVLELQTSHETVSTGNEPLGLTPKDQTGDKWQYLQEELLFRKNAPCCQFDEAQVTTKINILPLGATSSVRAPTVEELKTYTAQLDNLSQEASSQIQENETGENALSLDQKLFELLLAISRCLNNMEQMLGTCVLSSEEAPVQQVLYETLSAELQKLHTDIGDKKDDLLKSITSAGGNSERFSQCFSNLQAWLQLTQTAAAFRSESVKTEMDHYINYQNEIRHLYDALIEKKSSLQQFFSGMSGHNISKQFQQVDVFELELQNFETQAAKLRDHGERFHLPVAITHEVYKLEEVLDDLWEILRVKQKELSSSFINEQQYEALLQGLAELIDLGKGKLAHVSKLKITSQSDLHIYLQNHKSFFCKLNGHMLLVQKVAASILQKREKFWNDVVQEIKSLEEQAIQHGTRLENLLQDWIAFDENYVSFCQKLEAFSPTVPFVTLVEETEERVMERTQFFQEIKKNIEGEQVKYYQIVKEGKNLIELLSCPELQCQVEKLEHQWASLFQRVDHELQRLERLHKLLSSYSKDSKELHVWLESARQKVNYWKEQSLNASQDLNTVRNHIQSLLEFSKEADDKSSLKSSVISTGNQLLLIKETDAAKLRSSLAEYEQRWTDLRVQLPVIQEKFHQLQMAKLPSHEAITELNAWMNCIDQQRRNEVIINLQSPASQVKGLLRKYKEYVMEMNFKQWIVDYVNQSLLQLTPCDVESKRYERTSFAECLGELNVNWHCLQGTLNGKIKELEHILESVVENENEAQSLGSWLEAQSRRLKCLKNPASSILAQDTVKDCKVLENQLAVKSKDVDQLKNYHTALEDCADAAKKVVFTTNDLDEMKTSIINQVAQLKSSTQSALECWKSYDEAWDEIRLMLANALYCLEHSMSPVITVKTLKKQVEDLQSLQDKNEDNKEIWARLQTAADNLKKLCDPSFSEIIEQKHKEARTRWMLINKNIEENLQKAHTHLHLWESYTSLYNEVSAKLDKYEEQCDSQLMSDTLSSYTTDSLKQKAQDIKKLQLGLQDIKEYFLQASEPGDKITQLAEPGTQPLLQEKLQPFQRISCLEKMLQMKADVFQYGLLQLENFGNSLEKLENHVKESTEILDNSHENNKDLDLLMSQLLSLTSLSPEMERLNEVSFRLPLCDFTVKRLQSLNRQWTQKTAMVLEQCSELQNHQSDEKKFLQQCQNWVQFLEKMKESLKENMAGTLEKLQEQQKEHEILQAEISINQQIFSSVVSKALHMLESGEVENRTEFISRLTLLKEQWQSVVRMVHRKKSDIDSLVKQWQKFTTLLQDLTKFLMDTNNYIAAVKSQDKYGLHQIRNLEQKFKNKEILQKRWQTRYSLILDTGEKLLGVVAPEAKAAIQLEMSQLQDSWDNTQLQLEKITRQFQGTIQTWENCERQVKDLGHVLLELKGRINKPLPAEHDALQATMEHVKELEKSLANWSQNAKELDAKKVELAHFILEEGVMVLKEQVEHLHSQWEELCLRVSLCKQDIEGRLNAWIVFNEKNKKLCAWLVQMEGKVLQSADTGIEGVIEKLQKDYMEEINLFNESQLVHFKEMGDQLIKSSSKSRGAEIEEKLNKINDRWQHLFDVIGGRVKKLKETFAFIQQLDKNMSHLHTWLAHIESELSKPIVYDICDDQEIQKRLAEQQDLQRDIEQHTAGVESVFNICEVLLHDSDACANETECDSIQQTTRSLERRWRNICAMSMERRMKIDVTWRLWQKFLEDYSRFEVWLKTAERTAAYPNSSEILYVNAKEELKKFEAFQRQIHERLTQLELINKQYRRLARENRTDSANKLKQMVYEGNHRWDNLQKRVTAILRRLKHFTNQWEEFMGTKDNILVWLTEMDLQLTNVEHFSKSNFDDKMRQLNGFQREITLNTNKIDQLIVSGEYLIQKSEPEDAIILEEELEEFHSYRQEVFGRVARFRQRLTSWHPGLEDEKETSENEADSDHASGMQNDPWPKKTVQEVPSSQQSLSHLMPTAVRHERSGCETPVSVDSIPLEWDHTGDVGGSSSPEEEEEESYFSALSDVEITEHPEAYLKMTTKALKAASGKSAETHIWHPSEHAAYRKHSYNQEEMVRSVLSNSKESSTSYKPGNVKPLSTRGMDDMKDISRILPSKDSQDSENFVGISAIEKQPGTIERWELIQVQDLSNKLRMKQTWQQWQQLNTDLTNIDIWLDKMEEEMEGLQEAESQPVSSIQAIEQRVKKLKDMFKAYNNYKALVLSVNLTSKDFKQTDSTGCKELQNRLRRVNLRWEKANLLLENWKKNLQKALIHCQDFHEQNRKLLLWLAAAETRRHQAQIKDPNADPHRIQESRKELMQLEKELLEWQLQVNTLQEIASYLLVKPDGEEYIEADEKVHVIGKKLKQLLEGVSCDLKVSQGSQDISEFLLHGEELDSVTYHQLPEKPLICKNKASCLVVILMEDREETNPVAPEKYAFIYRVLRAALPLQLFFLLVLFLASLIPVSEEDYSCTQTNNFARSFYPMLQYINGPPPT
ncbi:nesprin-2 [Candoia aspera]|uniref:nesprin-2 n=1 Tax=Candoia aspera TaxID=51853 RepID=UPI002FD7F3D3